MNEEELREKVIEILERVDGEDYDEYRLYKGPYADELIAMITKEKAGEIFDRCVEAVKDSVSYCPDMDMIIDSIEQERKRYE